MFSPKSILQQTPLCTHFCFSKEPVPTARPRMGPPAALVQHSQCRVHVDHVLDSSGTPVSSYHEDRSTTPGRVSQKLWTGQMRAEPSSSLASSRLPGAVEYLRRKPHEHAWLMGRATNSSTLPVKRRELCPLTLSLSGGIRTPLSKRRWQEWRCLRSKAVLFLLCDAAHCPSESGKSFRLL